MVAATTLDPEAVRQMVREDSALVDGKLDEFDGILTSPALTQLRQEAAALQADVDSGKDSSAATITRVGVLNYLLGHHQKAIDYLLKVRNKGVSNHYQALALTSLGRHQEAEEQWDVAAESGYEPVQSQLLKAGAIRAQGRLDDSEAALKKIAKQAAGKGEYSYQVGCLAADRGDTYGAIEYFERAVDMDPHHTMALFRLAAEHANRGNDDDAIRLYEQSLSKPPYYLGSLLNLGLLYEDRENYNAAAFCFRKVLEFQPNHERARLYLRDIEATSDMYYDEESARQEARLEQLLNRPVTDFELSVRSRNCLEGMNIHTLGDLTRISEQDLLSGKNFGETSLHEIREMMSAHGLMIGQNLRSPSQSDFNFLQEELSPQEQAEVARPISDLNLSVRARKCMSRLGITTIGELVSRTPDELLSSRNFGVTSLNEVRSKLSEIGLKLRND